MIHNLTGWGAPVKAGNFILIVARIIRIKRTAGKQAGSATVGVDRPGRSAPQAVSDRRPTLRDKVP